MWCDFAIYLPISIMKMHGQLRRRNVRCDRLQHAQSAAWIAHADCVAQRDLVAAHVTQRARNVRNSRR